MKLRALSIIGLLAMLVWSACDTVSNSDDQEVYPVVYPPLEAAQLDALQEELKILSDNRVCNALDAFGFLSERFCSPSHPNPGIVLSEEQAIALAREDLVKLGTFTHIPAADQLVVIDARTLSQAQDGTEWRITFAPQEYEGYEVKKTSVSVLLYGNGIYLIYGHWYRDIVVPEVVLSADEAEQLLVGGVLSYSSLSGVREYEIIADDIVSESTERVILPYETGGNLELRVAWQVPVDMFRQSNRTSPEWFIYVDVVTGEVLEEKLLVIF